jgi:hypothetical protein
MRRVFFDTSAYIALADASDRFHAEASELARQIVAHRLPRMTTNYILVEAYTWIRRKLGYPAFVEFSLSIQRDIDAGRLQIVRADSDLDAMGLELMRKYDDQDFSFVDCVSFAWLQDHPEVEVFAFDQHFFWLGFRRFTG